MRVILQLCVVLLLLVGVENHVWGKMDVGEKAPYGDFFAESESEPGAGWLWDADGTRDAAPWSYDIALDVRNGPNLYAYVRQNPWTSFDPLGLESWIDPRALPNCSPALRNALDQKERDTGRQVTETLAPVGRGIARVVDGLWNKYGAATLTGGDPGGMRMIGSPLYQMTGWEGGEALYNYAIEHGYEAFQNNSDIFLSRPRQSGQNGPGRAPQPELKLEGGSKDTTARNAYMGKTPGKSSQTGKAVLDRMLAEGKIRTSNGTTEVLNSAGQWVDIRTTDMSHIKDAVKAWNEGLNETGAKSPEVRTFMKDPNNYELDSSSINRSKGGKLGEKYDPPVPYKTEEKKS
jgi:hypothetical protein